MAKLTCGFNDGKRWLSGEAPVRKNVAVEIDTRTGQGIDVIMKHMVETVSWHASKVKLPSCQLEDIVQELNVILLDAIPEYDVTKHANIMTFLQNHLRNRIVNLYKFATEKCRTAVHENYRLSKVKCPECSGFNFVHSVDKEITSCGLCGNLKKQGERWKSYPIPVAMVSANDTFVLESGDEGSIQELTSYEDIAPISGSDGISYVDKLISNIALQQIATSTDQTNRLIIKYLLEGRTLSDISSKTELSMANIRTRLANISKGRV